MATGTREVCREACTHCGDGGGGGESGGGSAYAGRLGFLDLDVLDSQFTHVAAVHRGGFKTFLFPVLKFVVACRRVERQGLEL